VPFGEYFPVPSFVRDWLRLMSLPYSDFEPGAARQPPLRVAGLSVAASICYEDAYPGELLPAIRAADLLVNVTNDAWFGRSGARYQHLQIARMRALESRRFLLRAANDGVSAVIGTPRRDRGPGPRIRAGGAARPRCAARARGSSSAPTA
jgi:apolipoprotein N-acyltransferase